MWVGTCVSVSGRGVGGGERGWVCVKWGCDEGSCGGGIVWGRNDGSSLDRVRCFSLYWSIVLGGEKWLVKSKNIHVCTCELKTESYMHVWTYMKIHVHVHVTKHIYTIHISNNHKYASGVYNNMYVYTCMYTYNVHVHVTLYLHVPVLH